MSHSTLWLVFRTRARRLAEYRNGHGSAPPIWDLCWSRYVEPGLKFPLFTEGRHSELWALANDPRVTVEHRIALALTFDRALVRTSAKELRRVADALDVTHRDVLAARSKFAPPFEPAEAEPHAWTWSHLPEIAKHLRLCANPCACSSHACSAHVYQRLRSRALGIGLGCTSVHDPWEAWNGSGGNGRAVGYVLDLARA